MNIYDFTVKAQDGSDVALSQFAGKAVLVVNTATGCADQLAKAVRRAFTAQQNGEVQNLDEDDD